MTTETTTTGKYCMEKIRVSHKSVDISGFAAVEALYRPCKSIYATLFEHLSRASACVRACSYSKKVSHKPVDTSAEVAE
jgi:hypothetical protein